MGGGGSKASNIIDVAINHMLVHAAEVVINHAGVPDPDKYPDNICNSYIKIDKCCIDHSKISQTCDVAITGKTIQDAQKELEEDVEITDIGKQLAEEINTWLNINGKAEAKNVTSLCINLSQSVKTQLITNCEIDLSGVNSVSCVGSTIGNFTVNQSIVLTGLSNCSQNSIIISSAKQKLINYIEQVARAEVEDSITSIIILTAIIASITLFAMSGGPVFLTKLSRLSKALAVLLAVGIPLGVSLIDCKFTHVMCKDFQSNELVKTIYMLIALLVMVVFIVFMRS